MLRPLCSATSTAKTGNWNEYLPSTEAPAQQGGSFFGSAFLVPVAERAAGKGNGARPATGSGSGHGVGEVTMAGPSQGSLLIVAAKVWWEWDVACGAAEVVASGGLVF